MPSGTYCPDCWGAEEHSECWRCAAEARDKAEAIEKEKRTRSSAYFYLGNSSGSMEK